MIVFCGLKQNSSSKLLHHSLLEFIQLLKNLWFYMVDTGLVCIGFKILRYIFSEVYTVFLVVAQIIKLTFIKHLF